LRNFKKDYFNVIKELKNKAVKYYKDRIVSIVIFGSVAKDCFSPESDIDILFILEKKNSNYEEFCGFYENIEEKIRYLKKLKEKEIYIEIMPIFIEREKLSFNASILWDLKFLILYDKNDFFKSFSKKLKKYLKENVIFHKKPMPHYEIKNGTLGTCKGSL